MDMWAGKRLRVQQMTRLLMLGFLRLFFIFTPAVAVVFCCLYFGETYLIERGLKNFLFIPAVAAMTISFLLFHLILGGYRI
jgi:hypothetical protein